MVGVVGGGIWWSLLEILKVILYLGNWFEEIVRNGNKELIYKDVYYIIII